MFATEGMRARGLRIAKFVLRQGTSPNDATQFPGLHTAVYDQWNLNIEYQLPGQLVISPAYVGTKGTHLQVLTDRNQIPTPSANFDQNARPHPQFGPFTSITNRGNSTYHAFQLKAEKRTSHGLYFLSAYTFSKSINDQPEICCNSPWPQNSYDLAAEKGLSDFDNRHRWVTSFDYELPIGKGKNFLNQGGVLDKVVGGWHIGGIVTFRSGFPFSPAIGFDPSNTGSQGLMRSNQIGSGHVSNPGPNLWFNINGVHQLALSHGCASLHSRHVRRALRQIEARDARGDGSRGDNQILVLGEIELVHHAAQTRGVDAATGSDQTGTHFYYDAHRVTGEQEGTKLLGLSLLYSNCCGLGIKCRIGASAGRENYQSRYNSQALTQIRLFERGRYCLRLS